LDDDTLASPQARVEADYAGFEAATAQHVVASAIAPGWGGAAAAVARAALAGGLSANIDAGWSTQQWFSESAGGLLCTTADHDADTFSTQVPTARRIGTVADSETLVLDGQAVSTSAVLAAYRSEQSGEMKQ